MLFPDWRWIAGNEVLSISLIEPVSWRFAFGDGTVLRVDTLWRVVTDKVAVTSADHGHRFGLPERVDAGVRARLALAKARVRHASLSQRSGDLVMQFDNEAALEVLTTSTGYEGWSITSPTRDEIIGLGGGGIYVVPRT